MCWDNHPFVSKDDVLLNSTLNWFLLINSFVSCLNSLVRTHEANLYSKFAFSRNCVENLLRVCSMVYVRE